MRRWPGAPGKRARQAHAAMARRCGRARTTTAAPHAARPSWLGGHSYGGTATATSILRLQPRRPRGGLPALFPTMAPAVTVVGCQRISWPSSSMLGGVGDRQNEWRNDDGTWTPLPAAYRVAGVDARRLSVASPAARGSSAQPARPPRRNVEAQHDQPGDQTRSRSRGAGPEG